MVSVLLARQQIPKVKWLGIDTHDYAQVTQLGRDLVKAHPNLVKMESVEKSYEGKRSV
jgi:hypothetical protein